MEEASTTDEPEPPGVIEEAVASIRQAAGRKTVVVIRISIGKDVSISKVAIAKAMHAAFPNASVEISESGSADSVVVKDIEVE